MAKSNRKIQFGYSWFKGDLATFHRSILGALLFHSEYGFTLEQVGRKLNLSRATVYNKIKKDSFTFNEMMKIADYFNKLNLFMDSRNI